VDSPGINHFEEQFSLKRMNTHSNNHHLAEAIHMEDILHKFHQFGEFTLQYKHLKYTFSILDPFFDKEDIPFQDNTYIFLSQKRLQRVDYNLHHEYTLLEIKQWSHQLTLIDMC